MVQFPQKFQQWNKNVCLNIGSAALHLTVVLNADLNAPATQTDASKTERLFN